MPWWRQRCSGEPCARASLGSTWRLSDEQLNDWVVTVASRLRCMLRHFSQSSLKNPNTPWVCEVRGDVEVPSRSASSSDVPAAQPPALPAAAPEAAPGAD
eukprot:3819680-Alexandrium_andersonii.AAC.1